MGSETVATLVLVAVLVTVLAVYLVAIGLALRKLSFTLGTIVIGLRAIAQQCGPVGPVIGDLIGDVDVIDDALESLIGAVVAAKKAPRKVPAVVASSRVAAPRSPDWELETGVRPATAEATDGEREDVVAASAVDDQVPVVPTAGGSTASRRRRSKSRSSVRSTRPSAPSAPGKGSMGAAVARAREKVGTRSRP